MQLNRSIFLYKIIRIIIKKNKKPSRNFNQIDSRIDGFRIRSEQVIGINPGESLKEHEETEETLDLGRREKREKWIEKTE